LQGDVVWFSSGRQALARRNGGPGMTHIAIAEALDGKTVDWLEKVSDEQYAK
jgi:quercetin dioxygenase-like cupin family protein